MKQQEKRRLRILFDVQQVGGGTYGEGFYHALEHVDRMTQNDKKGEKMRTIPLKIKELVTGKTTKIKENLMDFCKYGYCKYKTIPCNSCGRSKQPKSEKVSFIVIDKTISS